MMRVGSKIVALIVALLVSASVEVALARAPIGGQHPTIRLPTVGATVQGFRCDIEIGNVQIAGYVPVEITLKPVGTFTADRRFVVRVVTNRDSQTPGQNGLAVNLPIIADQGARVVKVTRYIPKWSGGHAVDVSVLENGRSLKDYAASVGARLTPAGYRYQELLGDELWLNWILIDESIVADSTTPPDKYAAGLGFAAPVVLGSPTATTRSWISPIRTNDLPTDWRAYGNHDVVLLSPSAIERVRANGAAFAALRDWVLGGGTIVVYEADSLGPMVESLGFTPTDATTLTKTIGDIWSEKEAASLTESKQQLALLRTLDRHIDDLKKAEANNPLPATQADESKLEIVTELEYGVIDDSKLIPVKVNGYDYFFPTDVATSEQFRNEMRNTFSVKVAKYNPAKPGIFGQSVGAGLLIGTTVGINDAESKFEWTLISSLFGPRASPMLRRGVDPLMGDRRFDRWMIPGVAQPPVYTFMGLLVGFVVLVGPVAYRKTSKSGRSYLMFLIAPVLAMLTTAAMFAYGIISDGFGTITRIRQITFVDGGSGDGGERIRSMYFAGVRPSDGIRFPANADVMWYPESFGMSWQDHFSLPFQVLGEVTIDDKSQRFDSSFLPSREQRQFVVHLPRRGIGSLSLIKADDGTPQIENGFTFPLRTTVVRDDDGEYWSVADLAAGASATAEPVDVKGAAKRMGAIYNDYRPVSTTKQTTRQPTYNYNNQVYDLILDVNKMVAADTIFTDGIFETDLQQRLQTSGEIPKGHFIATSDVSEDVIAAEDAETVESVRYLYGTLR